MLLNKDNTKHTFKVYQYGELIFEKSFEDDYEEAKDYYLSTYHNHNVATAPFINDVQLTFNQAYEYFEVGRCLKYYYIHSKRKYNPNLYN